jgi:hypothetical protein
LQSEEALDPLVAAAMVDPAVVQVQVKQVDR